MFIEIEKEIEICEKILDKRIEELEEIIGFGKIKEERMTKEEADLYLLELFRK